VQTAKLTTFFLMLVSGFCVTFPSQAFWFSGGYRPILNADPSTFAIGQSLGRAAGLSGFGYGGFGYGFGFGLWGSRPLSRFRGYPHPSYAQYKRLQVQSERLLAEKMQTYFAPQNQETVAKEIRKQENEFRNFEKTTTPEIRRLDKGAPEKKPQQSLVSKDGLVTVNYY
jgi:hypothetical protein